MTQLPDGFDTGPKYDEIGAIHYMVRSGGYVMVRYPRALPFVLSERQWKKLPNNPVDGKQFHVSLFGVVGIANRE